jgi:HK97 family phage major capsid protein
MPAQTDAMIARLEADLEERNAFIEGLIAGAQEANNNTGRDLNSQEMELIGSARARIAAVNEQLTPLRETSRIAIESRNRAREINAEMQAGRQRAGVGPVEYRSAGAYIADFVRAYTGNHEIAERLEVYNRAAAHQTTGDNPGLLPEQLLSPILGQLDYARPLVSALGPRQLPSGSWSRPRITQHTQVGKQSAEKTELPSRKMIIGKIPIEADTFGGYVNVSRQNVDWSQPQVVDIVIGDLTSEYAFETEEEAGTVITAAAQAGPTIPANATAQDVANALWAAAGLVFANMWAARMPVGRLILALAPDMLGVVGPLFAPVNPQNAQSSGFNAGAFGEGPQPAISGITPVVSGALAAGTAEVISSSAVEAYEDRIGALQVIEPSVLGTQVAYAGYFAIPVLEPTGIVKITKAP